MFLIIVKAVIYLTCWRTVNIRFAGALCNYNAEEAMYNKIFSHKVGALLSKGKGPSAIWTYFVSIYLSTSFSVDVLRKSTFHRRILQLFYLDGTKRGW